MTERNKLAWQIIGGFVLFVLGGTVGLTGAIWLLAEGIVTSWHNIQQHGLTTGVLFWAILGFIARNVIFGLSIIVGILPGFIIFLNGLRKA